MDVKLKIKKCCQLISEKKLQLVLDEFTMFCQNYVEHQAEMALVCLISGSRVAHQCFTGNEDNEAFIEELYKMCVLCCNVLSRNWDIVKTKFVICTYHYCRYCLRMGKTDYAIAIVKYVTSFLKQSVHDLSDSEREGLKGFICIFTQNVEIYHTLDFDTVCEFWCGLFQICGYLQFDVMNKLIEVFTCKFIKILEKENVENRACSCFVNIIERFITIWNEFSCNILPERIDSVLGSFVKLLTFIYDHFLRSCKCDSSFRVLLQCIDNMEFHQRSPYVCALLFTVKTMKLMKSALQTNSNVTDETFLSHAKWCMNYFTKLRTTNLIFEKQGLFFIRCLFYTSYNMATELVQQEDYKSSTRVCHRTLCLYCICDDKFIFTDKELSLTVYGLVKTLCDCFEQQSLHEQVLRVAVLWTVLCPLQSSKFLLQFLQTKLKTTDTTIQDLTYYDFLITDKNKILIGWPVTLPEFDIESLLIQELRLYIYRRFVSWSAVTNVVRRLTDREFKLGDDYTKLLLCGRHTSHYDMDIEYSRKILPGIEIALNDLKGKYNADEVTRTNIIYLYDLGNLYHVRFHLRLQRERMEVKDRKTRYVNSATQKGERDRYEQLEAVISTATSFETQAVIFDDADKAVQFWRKAFFSDVLMFKEVSKDDLESRIFADNLIAVAFNYMKNCWFEKAISVFKFLFHVAVTFELDPIIITVAEQLLTVQQNEIENELKSRVELSLPNVSSKVRVSYRISELKCHLLENPTFVYQKLKEIDQAVLEESFLLRAEYDFLLGQCELLLGKVFPDALITLKKALDTMANNHKKFSSINESLRIDCLFMNISIFLGYCFAYTFRTAEAYLVIRSCFESVPILCCPLRLCQALVLLCWCDINVGDFDLCKMRLNHLVRILDIDVPRIAEISKSPTSFAALTPVTHKNTTRRVVASIRTEIPVSFVVNNAEHDRIRLSEFTAHSSDCTCRRCGVFEYTRVIVQLSSLCLLHSFRCPPYSGMSTEQIEVHRQFVNKITVVGCKGTFKTVEWLFNADVVNYEILSCDYAGFCNDFKSATTYKDKAKRTVRLNYFAPFLYDDIMEREIYIVSATIADGKIKNVEQFDQPPENTPSSVFCSPAVELGYASNKKTPSTAKESKSSSVSSVSSTPARVSSKRRLSRTNQTVEKSTKDLTAKLESTPELTRKRTPKSESKTSKRETTKLSLEEEKLSTFKLFSSGTTSVPVLIPDENCKKSFASMKSSTFDISRSRATRQKKLPLERKRLQDRSNKSPLVITKLADDKEQSVPVLAADTCNKSSELTNPKINDDVLSVSDHSLRTTRSKPSNGRKCLPPRSVDRDRKSFVSEKENKRPTTVNASSSKSGIVTRSGARNSKRAILNKSPESRKCI